MKPFSFRINQRRVHLRSWYYRMMHDYYRSLYRLIPQITRNRVRWKTWIGHTWIQFAPYLFGTSTRLAINSYGYPMHVRPYELNDLTALFGRSVEKIVEKLVGALQPGNTFVDVGAHIGRYTLLAAGRVGKMGRVLAIEPEPDNFELLKRNVLINDFYWVRIFNVALMAENGTAQLISPDEDKSICTLFPSWPTTLYQGAHCPYRSYPIDGRALDSLMTQEQIDIINLLKIDVEGGELQVLKGALQALQQKRIQSIVCEVHQPICKLSDIITFLERLGYVVSPIKEVGVFASAR